ncbi:hypothetical protein H0H93_006220 [Arthromyces matolae]|nr:hypothetical protein H0H93_006220 [Arthromyces matolae]
MDDEVPEPKYHRCGKCRKSLFVDASNFKQTSDGFTKTCTPCLLQQQRTDRLWILIHKVTAEYVAHAEVLNDTHRLGRTKALTTYQKYFKSSWRRLEVAVVNSTRTYTVDIENFTCNCGRQKYDRHHLCKHLVQAFQPPPGRFFTQVIRRRILPIYQHPGLIPKNSDTSPFSYDNDGGITDGDDHEWMGDQDTLPSRDSWKKLTKKRQISDLVDEDSVEDQSVKKHSKSEKQHHTINSPRSTTEFIDLTRSSPIPDPSIPVEIDDLAIVVCSSSPLQYGSGDEEEPNPVQELDMVEDPCDPKFGSDVIDFVDDIRRYESTGRKREATWAQGKSKSEQSQNSDERGLPWDILAEKERRKEAVALVNT